jgi:hypothetical protein
VLETGQVPFGPVMVVWTALVVCFGSWGGLSTCIGARGGGSDADLSERLAENRRFEHVYVRYLISGPTEIASARVGKTGLHLDMGGVLSSHMIGETIVIKPGTCATSPIAAPAAPASGASMG